MLTYNKVKKNTTQFQSLTGMSIEAFDYLHNAYVVQWQNFITHFTLDRKPRTRPYRSRKDSQLPTTQDHLLFILHYLKGNTIQEHHAAAYRMTQPLANLWIHLLLELLYKTLKSLTHVPGRRASQLNELLARVSEVYLDGTERDIQRPSDWEEQKEHFSGKKKAHKVKNDVLTDKAERVLFLSKTYPGSVHDKTIIEQEGWVFPQGLTVNQDLGFLGHRPEGVVIRMPVRKPRNGELTPEQKKENKQKASIRVKVEHAIGKVKVYRMLKDRIRLWKRGIKDLVMVLGCALHNFKLAYKTQTI